MNEPVQLLRLGFVFASACPTVVVRVKEICGMSPFLLHIRDRSVTSYLPTISFFFMSHYINLQWILLSFEQQDDVQDQTTLDHLYLYLHIWIKYYIDRLTETIHCISCLFYRLYAIVKILIDNSSLVGGESWKQIGAGRWLSEPSRMQQEPFASVRQAAARSLLIV